ncbi:MAG: dolichyl-phosphate beta-glucosyltransferase [Patescibacteria group bacterium]
MALPEISIIIPFKNEAARLPKSLATVLVYANQNFKNAEILLVNDGSTDNTEQLIKKQLKDPRVKLLTHSQTQGKGAAIRTGVLAATGKLILFTDADLSTPIQELSKLIITLAANDCDIVIGSRAVTGATVLVHQPLSRVLIGKSGNLLIRSVTGLPFHDTQCGFKLFKAKVAKELFREQHFPSWSFDIEILYKAKLKDYRICEVGVEWRDMPGSKVQSLSDPIRVLRDVFKIKHMYHRNKERI